MTSTNSNHDLQQMELKYQDLCEIFMLLSMH